MESKNYSDERGQLLSYFRKELIGPAGGEDERLTDSPAKRYLMGTLHPRDTATHLALADEEEVRGGDSDELDDSPLSLLFQRMPASVGLSFVLSGTCEVLCEVSGAAYLETRTEDTHSKRAKKCWQRERLPSDKDFEAHSLTKPAAGNEVKKSVLGGRADLYVIWRPLGTGWLVTVSLVNAAEVDEDTIPDPSDALYQVAVRCRPVNGVFSEYPYDQRMSSDEEEEELALIYRDNIVYSVGHGCAANWQPQDGTPEYVEAEFMPSAEVKPVTTTAPGDKKDECEVLRLQYLGDASVDDDELRSGLESFVDQYDAWLDSLRNIELPQKHKPAAARVLSRISDAAVRMRRGIDAIFLTKESRQAFSLANRAMLIQMIHSGPDYGGSQRARDEKPFISPDYASANFTDYLWRPFQLAFQLLVIESLIDEKSSDRELVDLLWFPTGGGKTEAYLALAAFEMIRRRLAYGEQGGGTAVIKRYTLRLLTSQQFQRACTLICALECIRCEVPELLGGEKFSLGLWVGGDSSPNRYTSDGERDKGAVELRAQMMEDMEPENPFQLQQCPWCGTRLVPSALDEDEGAYGVRATQTTFSFFCPTQTCDFHDELPVSVVDEDLYSNPPTMVIGTVDKFARLTWDDRSGVFFGEASGRRPPSLIIQDELHLISGPLGTIAGVYEAAIDTAITANGVRPKVIAATATIRRAADQVTALFGRDVKIFPPSGISDGDSYFARRNEDAAGRLYVGVMGQGVTATTSLVQTAAVLSQSLGETNLSSKACDAWWTQLIYHNSRRELGKTLTLARDDIPARVKVIASAEERSRSLSNVEELSANVKGSRIPEVLEELKESYPSQECVDILPCTNMISVGVDVSRLGLMLINGQPKTTSEYIQASSRVGRSEDRPPGIVLTLYSSTKPRDRSHYETFVSYHNALYRWVEPTSVTPFAPPSRERALHAALVALMRLSGGLGSNAAAGDFDPNSARVRELTGMLRERMIRADASEADEITSHLKRLEQHWIECINQSNDEERPLRYDNKQSHQFMSLLTTFGNRKSERWELPTLNSMRNVDQETRISVIGEPKE